MLNIPILQYPTSEKTLTHFVAVLYRDGQAVGTVKSYVLSCSSLQPNCTRFWGPTGGLYASCGVHGEGVEEEWPK